MKTQKSSFLFVAIVIFAILLISCSQAPANTPITSQPQNQLSTQVESGQTPSSTAAAPSAPPDVPIMTGAYGVQVPNDLNITYKVDAPIKDVVSFYQTALQENGWTITNNPDSVVGAMAQMARSKENGDRITFSLQFNSVGNFTVVQIFLNRVATPITTP